MSKKIYVPFTLKGDLLDYTTYTLTEEQQQEADKNGQVILECPFYSILFKPNFEFYDTLQYIGYSRGRSSIKIQFICLSCGTTVEMFISDFDDMMEREGLHGKHVSGRFTFVKRGKNYGVKYLDDGRVPQ